MAYARPNKTADKPPLQSSGQSQRARPSVITDARRRQNRVAAKVYRDKRKRKIEILEQLASSQGRPSIPEIVPVVSNPIIPEAAESISATRAESSWAQGSQSIQTQEFETSGWNSYLDTTLLGNNIPCYNNRDLHQETLLHSSTASAGSTLRAPTFEGSNIYPQSHASFGSLYTVAPPLLASSQCNSDIGYSVTNVPPHRQIEDPPQFSQMSSSVNSAQWTSPSLVLESAGSGLSSINSTSPSVQHPPIVSPHRLVTFFNQLEVDQRRALLSITSNKRLKFTDVLSSLASSAKNPSIKEHGGYENFLEYTASKLPSLQLNNFRITQATFWAAIRTNAQVLGFELENYLHEEAISPISGPSVSFINREATENSSIAPKDLRPLKIQIEKEHHVYLDVLPFPKFRELTLMAVSHDPPFIDEEELCMDLMNDGLVCWGSQTDSETIDACMPWDSRSWEPQLWFLKKYWFLVGSQNDEMWSCTKWWHRIRGEKIC